MAAFAGGESRGPVQLELDQTDNAEGRHDLPFAALEEDPRQAFDENNELEAVLHGVGDGAARANEVYLLCGCCNRIGPLARLARRARQDLHHFCWYYLPRGLQVLQDSAHVCLRILHMLSCNMGFHLFSDPPRNVIFLLMSGIVFITAWEQLEPSEGVWALGLLYVLSASVQFTRLEPLLAASLALAAQLAYGLASNASKHVLWHVFGALCAFSEVCWWSSTKQLIDHSLHLWLVYFSTYYAVVIDFWLWPQALALDPEKWHITEKFTKEASTETKDAIVDVSVGLGIIILVPVLACTGIAVYIIWRRSPRLCLIITTIYLSCATVLLLYRNVSQKVAANIGQVPIAVIFVVLAREQFSSNFGDSRTWRFQAILMASLLLLRRLASILCTSESCARWAEVFGMLVFQFFFKQGLAAQCSALGFGGQLRMWRITAWMPIVQGATGTQNEQIQ